MARCKICGQDIVPVTQLPAHKWSAHRDEMMKQVQRAGATKKSKKTNSRKQAKVDKSSVQGEQENEENSLKQSNYDKIKAEILGEIKKELGGAKMPEISDAELAEYKRAKEELDSLKREQSQARRNQELKDSILQSVRQELDGRLRNIEDKIANKPNPPSAEEVSSKVSEKTQEQINQIASQVSSQQEAIDEFKKRGLCKDDESCNWLAQNMPKFSPQPESPPHKSAKEYWDCPECEPALRREGAKRESMRKEILSNPSPEERQGIYENFSWDDLSDAEKETLQRLVGENFELKPKRRK